LERAQLAYNTALAQLSTYQAALRAKEYDLQSAQALLIEPDRLGKPPLPQGIFLVAPVSGQVLRVLHESEVALAAGTPILEIGDPRKLEIVAELVSEDAVQIRAGAPARITDWGGAGVLHARVRRVEPSGFTKVSALGVEEQRVNVILDFSDDISRTAMADGYRLTVHITSWQSDSVLRVPVDAIFRRDAGWAAFAVRNMHAVLTPIHVGHTNDEVAEVRGGLRAGDAVIAHPSDRITDGAKVASYR
jgi:HlyD family secretion protein